MSARSAYVNARLLDPAAKRDVAGGVLVEGGAIVASGPEVSVSTAGPGAEVIDCGGFCLAPGLVDLRAELREPGFEHQETIADASRAAVAGGITRLVCMPNTNPVIDDVSLVEFVLRRAREVGRVNIHPCAAATRGMKGEALTEMGMLGDAGAVAFGDAGHAVADSLTMRRALSYARTFGHTIVQHPEDPRLAAGGAMNEGEAAARLGLPGIPAVAEVMMIERDLRLVELTGGKLHVAHVSTAESVAAMRAAKRRGLNVTCDTAPPYFALTEAAIGSYRSFAKLSPPLRGQADLEAVIEGLRDGTIDAVASDHSPHDQDSKRLPFAQASAGAVGLELLFPLVLELFHNGGLPLLDVLRLVTCGPADVLGLPGGRLEPGQPGDFVIFDLERIWKFDAQKLRGKCKNTPFDGKPMQGLVRRTVNAGRTVHVAEA